MIHWAQEATEPEWIGYHPVSYQFSAAHLLLDRLQAKLTGEYKQLQASEPAIEIWKIGLKKRGEALGWKRQRKMQQSCGKVPLHFLLHGGWNMHLHLLLDEWLNCRLCDALIRYSYGRLSISSTRKATFACSCHGVRLCVARLYTSGLRGSIVPLKLPPVIFAFFAKRNLLLWASGSSVLCTDLVQYV
jgi:hypothetical protein